MSGVKFYYKLPSFCLCYNLALYLAPEYFKAMQCAKLNLLDRSKKVKTHDEKPTRYCQKQMVNPNHENSVRWLDVLDRYCEKEEREELNETIESSQTERETPDLCLSVQNIQFQGDVQQRKRPRTSFKYKNCLLGQKHRMFVKEIVEDIDFYETERMSELTCYGDYAKYFQNLSRRSSKESIVFKQKESKSVQVDMKDNKKPKREVKVKKQQAVKLKESTETKSIDDKDTKVSYHKYGTRKSLTITRAESPETVQIIRVDVICNHSNTSTMSDYEEKKQHTPRDVLCKGKGGKNMIYDKYLLTNTVKTLDENISGGKVTLLCKTFRLTDRCRRYEQKSKHHKETKRCRVQK